MGKMPMPRELVEGPPWRSCFLPGNIHRYRLRFRGGFSRIRPLKKLLVVLFILVWATVSIPVGAYLFWAKTEEDGLRSIQAQIKQSGLPTSHADLFPKIPPDDRNAATLLKNAAELVRQMPKDSQALLCVPGSFSKNDTAQLPEKEVAAMRAFLAEPAAIKAVKLLSQAARKEECYFARDYAKGVSVEIPDATSMLSAIHLLLNHSWCLAKDEDIAGAVRKINSGMRIGEFYMNDPVIITWLVGVSCEQRCLSGEMNLISTVELTSVEIDDLEMLVKNHRKTVRALLVRAFDGERVFFGGSIFERFLSSKISLNNYLTAFGATDSKEAIYWVYQHPLRPLLVADYAAYLRFMLGIRKVILDPQSGDREAERLAGEIPRTALLTRLVGPGLESLARTLRETEASLDLAILGLNAEKFRIANGHYPQSLAEIPWEGALPRDPFTGGDFHYKADGGDLLIYSVGPDLVDNHGNPTKSAKGEKDIVWSVRRSPVPADSK